MSTNVNELLSTVDNSAPSSPSGGSSSNLKRHQSDDSDGSYVMDDDENKKPKKSRYAMFRRKCAADPCDRDARSGSDFCIRHGGGPRCIMPNCTRGARDRTGYCIRHGGGPRCQVKGCPKGAEKKNGFCILHGRGVSDSPTKKIATSEKASKTLSTSQPNKEIKQSIKLSPITVDKSSNSNQEDSPTPKRVKEQALSEHQLSPEKTVIQPSDMPSINIINGNTSKNVNNTIINTSSIIGNRGELLSTSKVPEAFLGNPLINANVERAMSNQNLQSVYPFSLNANALSMIQSLSHLQTTPTLFPQMQLPRVKEPISPLLNFPTSLPSTWLGTTQSHRSIQFPAVSSSILQNSLFKDNKMINTGSLHLDTINIAAALLSTNSSSPSMASPSPISQYASFQLNKRNSYSDKI